MSESVDIKIYRETVNDDVVIVRKWHCSHGDFVNIQMPLVDIETSKTTVEMEAETSGYLEIIYTEGSEVPVNEIIGRLHKQEISKIEKPIHNAEITTEDSSSIRVSKKAKILMAKENIDISVFN